MSYKSFDKDKFHVITMISNPVRFKSRYHLYQKFAEHMKESGVNLWTCELALGDRPFAITEPDNPKHLQLRYWDELWHKENALNQMMEKLPQDWQTLAWIDADLEFVRRDWVEETLNQLQVYQIVQMFETAVDLGPSGQAIATHKSFMSQYLAKGAICPNTEYQEWHPGYAWAARREAIDSMGRLYDKAILGAGDRHMALSFIGKAQYSFHPATTSDYQRSIMVFQDRCEKSIRRDVGCVPGTIIHGWHGKKKDRRYGDRWKILVDNKYIPWQDIKMNNYGVYQLHDDHSDRFLRLRDEIRAYMRSRNEDSIDMD